MPQKKKASKNRQKRRVTIVIVGVSEAVMQIIDLLHLAGLAKSGDWLEVTHTQDRSEVTMTIAIHFML